MPSLTFIEVNIALYLPPLKSVIILLYGTIILNNKNDKAVHLFKPTDVCGCEFCLH